MEIKFRAINNDGKFIYGLPYTDGVNETMYYKEFSNRLCWRNAEGAHCNQPYKNGTLMQFTGLVDKNGIEIYEGDLLDFDERVWGGTFHPESIYMDSIIGKWNYSGSVLDVSKLRAVVGNVHGIKPADEGDEL